MKDESGLARRRRDCDERSGSLSLPTRSYDSVPILIIYVVPSWVEPLFLPEIDRD